MKSEIGVCVIGAGRAGMIHARNFLGRIPNAKLIAVVDADEKAARLAKQELGLSSCYTDYFDALENPFVDAVVVVTPTRFHHKIVLDACAAKKHILCEKPMAMTEQECDEMIEAAKSNGVILQLAFMRRFDRSFEHAKQVVDSGEIGEVVLIKSLTRGPSIPKEWMYDISVSKGPLGEVNSHDIDTLRWFAGSEIREVYAIAGNYRCLEAKERYPDFYDNVLMSLRFENGMQGSVDGAQGVIYGYDARVEILGTKGRILLGSTEEDHLLVSGSSGSSSRLFTKSWQGLFQDAYCREEEHFITCIREAKEPRVGGLDGKMAIRVVEAGNRSIKEGRKVTL